MIDDIFRDLCMAPYTRRYISLTGFEPEKAVDVLCCVCVCVLAGTIRMSIILIDNSAGILCMANLQMFAYQRTLSYCLLLNITIS
jgi:hypothetical protein